MSKKNRPLVGMGAGDPMFWQSPTYTNQVYQMFRQQILTLAMTRFEWVNIPSSCDERYLEWTLLTQGCATIAFPKTQPGIFYSTQAVYNSPPNLYDNPSSWDSIGNNGWRFSAGPSNGVFVWENQMRQPILQMIEIYARELTDIYRTAQINRMHQRTPYLLTGPQEKALDLKQVWKQIAGGEPAVLATDGISSVKVEAISTQVPFLGKELEAAMQNTWTRIYQMLGIPSLPFKAERQIEDEVQDQATPASMMALGSLTARREACEKLNNRFAEFLTDGPVDVVLRKDVETENYDLLHSLAALSALQSGEDEEEVKEEADVE